ncbi:MAG TPA: hypothetical protein VMW16_11155 [Sedimentisphaerales bacterium]|nr:hypothetical protein [Sedimentisphaerales bacterium]
MVFKYKWWIADSICLLLVVLSIRSDVPYQQNDKNKSNSNLNVDSTLGTSGQDKQIAKIPNSNSSGIQIAHDSENSSSSPFTQRPAKPVSIATPVENKIILPKNALSPKERVATAYRTAPGRYTNELPFTLEELKMCLESGDLRTGLYCGRDLVCDESTAKTPYGKLALGIALLSSEAFPECIPIIEQSLVLNEKTAKNQNCRYLANKFLAYAYCQIGYKEKALELLDEAFANAQGSEELRQVEAIKCMLENKYNK